MKKRLYKSNVNKKIDGVCGGIAEYIGIDPVLVRVIWILITACYGCGLLAYLICALVMPRKDDIVDAE